MMRNENFLARCCSAVSVPALFIFLIFSTLMLPPDRSEASEAVDLELVIATDVSFSMSYEERALQIAGFADAFRHPAVQEAIRAGRYGKIAVTVMEWGGEGRQNVIIPWTLVEDSASATALAGAIGDRIPGRVTRGTAIGDALARAAALFAGSPYRGTRRVVDVSGDGVSNRGLSLAAVRTRLLADGVTINGLPIVFDTAGPEGGGNGRLAQRAVGEDLVTYFESEVIGGPAAFALPAFTIERFREAIRRKLLREIRGFEEIASLDVALPGQPRRAATTWPTAARSSAEGAAR